MCGICGYFSLDKHDEALLKRMNDQIIHRGPDDDGFYRHRTVSLAARRLSIIDLCTGHQPLSSASGNCWIAYNGEVYNFKELRQGLQNKGVLFHTKTDTEVIVNLYEQEGDTFAKHLRGMFAVAIHDQTKNRLILARDPIGIKPLYYHFNPAKNQLVFGSELKTILQFPGISRELDHDAIDYYLNLEYIPAPLSIFKSIRKLPAGHILTFSVAEGLSIKPHWQLKPTVLPVHQSPSDLFDQFNELLKEAVRLRLIADVPLGAFLSGGIDSSAVVLQMAKLMDRPVETYSIGFSEGSYNELSYAQLVADHFKTSHHTKTLAPNILELTEYLADFLDEPLADFSNFPTYLVSKTAREGVTVALSGDGGDEIFGGYDHYLAQKFAYLFSWPPMNMLMPLLDRLLPPQAQKHGFINRLKRYGEGFNHPWQDRHFRWMQFLSPEQKKSLYSDALFDQDLLAPLYQRQPFKQHFADSEQFEGLSRDFYLDLKTYLPDNILVKVDRMSMATSLEARVPLLDVKLVEFAFSLPTNYKIKGRMGKWFFKESLRGHLPQEVIDRQKKGFSIPIKNWLKKELYPLVQEHLNPSSVEAMGLFNPHTVSSWVNEHLAGKRDHAHRLWALIQFSMWARRFR